MNFPEKTKFKRISLFLFLNKGEIDCCFLIPTTHFLPRFHKRISNIAMNEASILTFIALLVCLSLQVTASDTISADGPVAQTVNGQILCNEIVRNEATNLVDGIPTHYSSISCIVDPSYTLTWSKHIELTLENLEQEDEFKKQHKDAEAVGKSCLQILGGKIDRSTIIILPSIGA